MKLSIQVCFGAAYLAGVVICFGPATIESERAQALVSAKCAVDFPDDISTRRICQIPSPPALAGGLKALAWPFWLSYAAASKTSKQP
jgi:hypothetical protein